MMNGIRLAGWTFLGVSALLLAGCAGQPSRNTPVSFIPDMDYQGRYEPQGDRRFDGGKPIFSDNRASRRPVEGTVPIGYLKEDEGFTSGVVNNNYIGLNPLKIDAELLAHGQKRFNTYCSPCHDRTGQGRGVVGQRAIWLPTNLHEARVRDMNDGEIFNVVTMGRRSMPSYRFQVGDHDRWAIVAYVRALQRATNGTISDVPEDRRAELK